ncbi:polysaccharide biosynthesis protein [Acidaminobacter sp. JC074]|uniref:polysaccharide biosynthesis protein n=1 Tax=Acidaminobacter sp. JC074 TaxID=2530199 RepID=UPI001F0FB259|nr:nucleoside-diphosphate sugar epimerase/dehydratase [Acidaminobacter sp. JC074]MCH4890311.1 polysaccharide biosynthesis protein [Acidaminobacter sp. JC074]
MKRKIKKYYMVVFDLFAIMISLMVALLLKYGFAIPGSHIDFLVSTFFVVFVGKVMVYKVFSLYSSLWEYASIEELMQVVGAVLASNVLTILYMYTQKNPIPFGVLVNVMMIEILMVGGIRFSYRVLRRLKNHRSIFRQKTEKNVLIIGAGATGGMISKEIVNHPSEYGKLIGFVDDDPLKEGKTLNGVRILGNRYDIYSICKKYSIDEIILAIPSVDKTSKAEILEECTRTECELKTLPGITELIDGKVSMNQIRDVEIEDLLGRDTVNLDMGKIRSYIQGRTVLVTGGGGSIGSELCRQIAKYNPSQLIILDIYENNAYDIQNELLRKYPNINLLALIASVRDSENINRIFDTYKPEIVFHAAAHKHVPLMETAPREAILNNCFGTLNVAKAAHEFKTDQFVMISTDKAVNPTNVMGASKRICEMIIQSIAQISSTKFSGVRFGNVLGSNGSVIPLFKRQIKEGGPVTVTHENIIRYFMTIPEASQLVLQSGAYAKGGEIFVLDMGEPVKIYKLAEDLIRLSGFEPHDEIEIEVTGLRPGEKLYEELLMKEEGMKETPHSKIFIGKPMFADFKVLMNMLDNLKSVLDTNDNEKLREQIKIMVPSYRPNKELNEDFIDKGCTNEFETAYKIK